MDQAWQTLNIIVRQVAPIPKNPQIDRTGGKQTEKDIIGQKRTETDRNRQKQTETDKTDSNRQKWKKWTENGQKRIETDRIRHKRTGTDINGQKQIWGWNRRRPSNKNYKVRTQTQRHTHIRKSYIRHKDFRPFVRPSRSEYPPWILKGWTGELWSKTKTKRIHFFCICLAVFLLSIFLENYVFSKKIRLFMIFFSGLGWTGQLCSNRIFLILIFF